MHKLEKLSKKYNEKSAKLAEEYEQNLKDLLSERGLLNVRVIRKTDGTEGELRIMKRYGFFRILFYRVTKKGSISEHAASELYAWSDKDPLNDFESKESEDK